jgi:hypothetical protein
VLTADGTGGAAFAAVLGGEGANDSIVATSDLDGGVGETWISPSGPFTEVFSCGDVGLAAGGLGLTLGAPGTWLVGASVETDWDSTAGSADSKWSRGPLVISARGGSILGGGSFAANWKTVSWGLFASTLPWWVTYNTGTGRFQALRDGVVTVTSNVLFTGCTYARLRWRGLPGDLFSGYDYPAATAVALSTGAAVPNVAGTFEVTAGQEFWLEAFADTGELNPSESHLGVTVQLSAKEDTVIGYDLNVPGAYLFEQADMQESWNNRAFAAWSGSTLAVTNESGDRTITLGVFAPSGFELSWGWATLWAHRLGGCTT